MPSVTGTSSGGVLLASGPILGLYVAVSTAGEEALRRDDKPIPPPIEVVGMIDTGASSSVIQAGLLAPLGLQPVGVVPINTPSSTNVACPEYSVRLILPNNMVGDFTVIEAPLQDQNIQCLIGRDFLAQAVFVYIGYAGVFSLSI